MSDPKLYKVQNGEILSCDPNGNDCLTLSKPKDCMVAKEVDVKDGEMFAFCDDPKQYTFISHYLPKENAWDNFDFNITRCYMAGIDMRCDTQHRFPTSLDEEDNFLIVNLHNGDSSRAPISPNKMADRFVAHSKKIDADTLEDGLEQIGSFTNVLGGYNNGSLGFNDRWEKKQAIEYLIGHMDVTLDPFERQNIQNAIHKLEANVENDRMVFQPQEPIEDNQYCRNGICDPILASEPYYRHMDVATELATPALPLHRNIEVSDEQWTYITGPLQNDTGSAEAEREALREVQRRWEIFLASKIGTGADIGGWIGNLVGFIPVLSFITGQTTCNEETTNNIGLVHALETADYLRYHTMDYTMPVATIVGMHQSVLFYEKGTNEKYVLDSWPMGSGRMPIVTKEKDWNFITTLPYNNLPSYDAWSEGHPLHRAATDLLGGWLLSRNVRKELGMRQLALGFAMPDKQKLAYFRDSRNAWGVAKYENDFSKWPYPPFGEARGGLGLVRNDYKKLLPKSLVGDGIGGDYHIIFRSRTPIENPFEYVKLNFLKTARGALSTAGLLFFATDLVNILLSGKSNGIPDSSSKIDIQDQLISYAATLYLGAEGALAVRVGAMPGIYELGVAMLPLMGGSVATSMAANAVGEQLDVQELQYDEPANKIIGLFGGIAAMWGAKKLIGEAAWASASEGFQNFVLSTIGRAGLYVEETVIPATAEFATETAVPWITSALRTLSQISGRVFSFVPVIVICPDMMSPNNLDGSNRQYL